MSQDHLTPETELILAALQRNSLARSLLLRTFHHARGFDGARSLRTLSQLGASLAAGLARRPASDDAGIHRLLAEAARRVRERAAGDAPGPP
jgi:hypothetical protein